MYLSSKSSSTNRRINDVLPTAASPTRHTFIFILRTSIGAPFGAMRSLELAVINVLRTLLSVKVLKGFRKSGRGPLARLPIPLLFFVRTVIWLRRLHCVADLCDLSFVW